MSLFIKYYPKFYKRKNFIDNLLKIKEAGFDGVFFPSMIPEGLSTTGSNRIEFFPISRMVELAKGLGLKTGVILRWFHSSKLWSVDTFSPPVSFSGASYNPDSWYHPVCPNNPSGLEYCDKLLRKMSKITQPDYFYLVFFRFPFFWEKEELDVQNRIPPFCYCPFCLAEFSSVVGEIINSTSKIIEMMPEWLEWRTVTIMNLLIDAKEVLAKKSRVIVSLPPLSLIDLPFTTGQLPLAFTDEGCLVSPLLHHISRRKNLLWVEDILDQYRIDVKTNKMFPSFEVSNKKEFEKILELGNHFAGIIFSHWETFNNLGTG